MQLEAFFKKNYTVDFKRNPDYPYSVFRPQIQYFKPLIQHTEILLNTLIAQVPVQFYQFFPT